MKKSFMTRALATGLSLAMAFSLSAATNVTVASAASTPAMASKQFAVRVGGATKTYKASAATLKKFKITKATVGNTSKATVKVASSKKGIKVTPGTVAGSTVVKVTFKNSKTKKTTTKKYRCVVKAKKDESYKITSATATGVKTITVELNKAVANTASLSAVVKKGTAARESKFTVDGSKIIIAMDAKLTAGAYTVTLEGLEATALTADLTVEKDETLTSFEIADYIVAKSTTATTTGTIKYAALNQYGEKMVSTEPTVTCSFGTVANQKPTKPATATAEGVIEVTDISPMLAIIGTKGTVVLVGDMGVTATKEISYNSAATASTVEIAGTYHKNSATLKNITEGDTIVDYELLLTAKDQYGYAMSADEFKDVNASLAGGLTNLSIKLNGDKKIDYTTRTLDGVDYIAIPLEGNNTATKAVAGDATLTIVNPYKGLLTTTTVTVVKNVVIKSLNITADNGVYAGQDNELNYEAVDADGKSVTSFAVLSNLLDFRNAPGLRIEKNKDGSAKMIYTPSVSPTQANTDKASQPVVITVAANSQVGGEYLVKTVTLTVYQERYAKSVLGIAADQTTSISSKATKGLEIKSTKFVLADQYSNKLVDGDKAFNKAIFDGTTGAATGTAVYVATNGAVNVSVTTASGVIVATPAAVGTATVYLKYCYDPDKPATASSSSYDAKFSISVFNTAGVDASGLEVKSVNDGFAVKAEDASGAALKAKLKVVAKVGGTETVIPDSQYEIVKCENNSFTADDDAKNVKTKTAKVTVQVTTWDSSNTNIETQITKEFEVSRADAKLFKVTKANGASTAAFTLASGGAVLNADSFVSGFEFKNQYGEDATAATADAGSVKYDIRLVTLGSETPTDGYTISSGGLNTAKVTFTKAGTYTLKITATTDDGSSKDYQLTVTVS